MSNNFQNYGQQVLWSTVGAPTPVGGICEDYTYDDKFTEADMENVDGSYAATVLHSPKAAVSFNTTVTSTSSVPVLGADGGCKIAVTGLTTGNVLLTQVVEKWSVLAPRTLSINATHFPDLATGGSTEAATSGSIDAITTPPLVVPSGAVGWGTSGVGSATGIIQSLTITQRVKHSEITEGGKIIAVIAAYYDLLFSLEVLALASAAIPVKGDSLALSSTSPASPPARFQTGNVITGVSQRFKKSQGVVYAITARWFPAMTAGS